VDIYQEILKKYWGHEDFRPLQRDIIESIAQGRDTLALMPTGGGKSITFQVPTLAKEGLCLVVTPLIALMRDQVENLKKRDIKAVAVFSGMTKEEVSIALDNCIFGGFKFLYIAPERLSSELFLAKLRQMNVSFVAVDEAHCISQWGYDFRPSYLKIADIREQLPDVPFLALTATATLSVIDDIQLKLHFKEQNILKTTFGRKNLIYVVRYAEDKNGQLLNILSKIKGSGIIYVRNRKKTKEYADFLKKSGISAEHYHAGLDLKERSKKQDEWQSGMTRIMVATNAFGMGIDKSDVRIVIHIDLPDTIEEYFQEAGRAGRDGKKSWAVLLTGPSDKLSVEKRIQTSFPEPDVIKRVYQAMGNFFQLPLGAGKGITFDFNIAKFASTFNFSIITVYNSLKILQNESYIELTEDIDNPSRVHFIVSRDDLYKFQVANMQFDGFIKLLLRSYTGLFNDFVAIDEEILSSRARLTRDEVYKYLVKLNNLKVIRYIPRKKTPMIIYPIGRLEDKELMLTPDNYSHRKDKYIKKLMSVWQYASETNQCRSQFLLSYFGEEESEPCGQCDICQKQNASNISSSDFEIIANKIRLILLETPSELNNLMNALTYKEEKTMKVIQWLLDSREIVYNAENKLTLSSIEKAKRGGDSK
jgi:ATP-dependent DNA helicase RecQ